MSVTAHGASCARRAAERKSRVVRRRIATALGLEDPNLAALLIELVATVNYARLVLPKGLHSPLLFRAQFLTWYHSIRAFLSLSQYLRPRKTEAPIHDLLTRALGPREARPVQKLVRLRNHLAHYELTSPDPMGGLVQQLTPFDLERMRDIVTNGLERISSACRSTFHRDLLRGTVIP